MTKPGRRPTHKRPPRALPGGYFSLERRLLTEDMRGDAALFLIWATLIGWANIADGKQKIGGQQVIIKRGQVATGLDELAKEWQLAIKTVRRCFSYLVKTGRVTMQSGNHGTIITICKYDAYQKSRKERASNWAGEGHAEGTQGASEGHAEGNIITREPEEPGNQGTRELFPEIVPDDAPASRPRKAKVTRSEIAAEAKVSKSGPTWDAYSTAIRLFHNFDPKPSAQVRSQACKLVDLLGADVAPEVAEYYVLNEKRHWVVQARHPFGELLKNAQKYFGDWTTGQKVSTAAARTIERDDANRDAIRQYRANQKSSANLGG